MLDRRITPEWHRQDAVLLAWPDEKTDWQQDLPAIHATFREIIQVISRYQQVVLLVHDLNHSSLIETFLGKSNVDLENIIFLSAEYDDTWLRDSGPINIQIGEYPAYIDYRFNGWGNKFTAQQDDRICQQLFSDERFLNHKLIHSDIILEGGSIDTNGHGVLLTTESCLLSTTRNPTMSREDYERHFEEQLGIRESIWLAHGELAGDDTDGHIDMLARFCNERTIAYSSCNDPHDQHYTELKHMEQEIKLKAAADHLVALPIPSAIINHEGRRLPASYANFLIINGAVLVPVYDDPNDKIACQRLADVFADREIIPINALSIIKHGGSLHCLTMQLNEGFLNKSK